MPPTVDTLQGASAVGKQIMKAEDAGKARAAIGAGTSNVSRYADLPDKPTIPPAYTLPNATTSTIGGVKKAAAVSTAATDADAAAIVTTLNDLITKLKTAGIIS